MIIVVKIGTNLLTAKDGTLDKSCVKSFVSDIVAAKKSGHSIVLVTSGAIGAGIGRMKLKSRPKTLKEKQALAAIGQPVLMDAYQEYFEEMGQTIAQVLLTRQDFVDRERYLNARNTMLTLIEMGVIPVINENDTVAVEEINFSGNDMLAALVAAKISADLLVILTDVDGLYDGEPGKGKLIRAVEKITGEIESLASDKSGSGKGVGGMKTKIEAAKVAGAAGVTTVIANGSKDGILNRISSGEKDGTVFAPSKQLEARKCWIAFGTKCSGRIFVDKGAAAAIVERGKSLLASGITKSEGKYEKGDTVSVLDADGKEVARGLVAFSSAEIDKIKGKKSAEIAGIIGYAGAEEVIHRDNLVIL
ncbi:MAG: glutamate 5-kinase [Elusimicrobiota bacterium]